MAAYRWDPPFYNLSLWFIQIVYNSLKFIFLVGYRLPLEWTYNKDLSSMPRGFYLDVLVFYVKRLSIHRFIASCGLLRHQYLAVL